MPSPYPYPLPTTATRMKKILFPWSIATTRKVTISRCFTALVVLETTTMVITLPPNLRKTKEQVSTLKLSDSDEDSSPTTRSCPLSIVMRPLTSSSLTMLRTARRLLLSSKTSNWRVPRPHRRTIIKLTRRGCGKGQRTSTRFLGSWYWGSLCRSLSCQEVDNFFYWERRWFVTSSYMPNLQPCKICSSNDTQPLGMCLADSVVGAKQILGLDDYQLV